MVFELNSSEVRIVLLFYNHNIKALVL